MSRPRTLAELPRWNGAAYGQATDLAHLLTSPERPITPAMVRKWAWQSRRPGHRLHGLLPGVHLPGARTGLTWYRLTDAARVAALTEPDHVR